MAPPPIRSHTGQLMPKERDWAGAGNGASAVGWIRADGGVAIVGLGVGATVPAPSAAKAEALVSAPTSRVWHFGQTDLPFAYHVQQVRQTARLKVTPTGATRPYPNPITWTSHPARGREMIEKQPARILAGCR